MESFATASFMKHLFILCLLFASSHSFASEKLFGYSYGAEPFPKGAMELYGWVTMRNSKGQGTYQVYDVRQEFEYGLTDKTAVSFYLNQRHYDIQNSAPVDDDGNAEYPNKKGWEFQGSQFAIIHNFISPYQNKHGVGFSLYVEPGYSRVFKITGQRQDEYSLEMKLLFQKNLMDDTMFFVFNFNTELEYRRIHGEERQSELANEITTGLSKRIANGTFIGLEGRYHTEYPSMNLGNQEHYAYFLGPNIHYAEKEWWVTLTYLPQIAGWQNDASRSRTLHLHEHESYEMRLVAALIF